MTRGTKEYNGKSYKGDARGSDKSYVSTGMLNLNYVFYIPVYKNMPEKTSLPTKTGWPNNYL